MVLKAAGSFGPASSRRPTAYHRLLALSCNHLVEHGTPRPVSPPVSFMDHVDAVARVREAQEGLPIGAGTDMGGAYSSNDTALVYGEITEAGMGILHDALGLRSDDVLYDLGSGVGKFFLYSALRAVCSTANGIEVGEKRHSTAERSCMRLTEMLESSRQRDRCSSFSAILGDITNPIYKDATVCTCCNIMFGGLINGKLINNFLTRCPKLRTVASIVKLHSPRLKLRSTKLVPCTWCTGGVSWSMYDVLPPMPRLGRESAWLHRPHPPPTPWNRPASRAPSELDPTTPPALGLSNFARRPATTTQASKELFARLSTPLGRGPARRDRLLLLPQESTHPSATTSATATLIRPRLIPAVWPPLEASQSSAARRRSKVGSELLELQGQKADGGGAGQVVIRGCTSSRGHPERSRSHLTL